MNRCPQYPFRLTIFVSILHVLQAVPMMFTSRFREMRIGFEIRQAQQCFIIFELKFEPIVKSSFRVRIQFPSLRKTLRRVTGRDKSTKTGRNRRTTGKCVSTVEHPSTRPQYFTAGTHNSSADIQPPPPTTTTTTTIEPQHDGGTFTATQSDGLISIPHSENDSNNNSIRRLNKNIRRGRSKAKSSQIINRNGVSPSYPEGKLEKNTVSTLCLIWVEETMNQLVQNWRWRRRRKHLKLFRWVSEWARYGCLL